VFVLTHHERDPQPMQGGTEFRFVTDGPASAVHHPGGPLRLERLRVINSPTVTHLNYRVLS